ncbi:MAG: rhamnulose-1-phosphate aldolase [Bacteroidales bacterium]|nr:rhamnulose-1-phosphate aldolase [Bacteroidales bacterium]MCF8406059.1 rhamnulose-1-phosphate aldolase [Bacteroidales bacterium]
MREITISNGELKNIISEIKSVAQLFYQRGWAESNAGNLSVNVTSVLENEKPENIQEVENFSLTKTYKHIANQYFIMSGSGIRFRDIAAEALNNTVLIKIAEDGKSYFYIVNNGADFAKIKPTSELPTHLAIHDFIQKEKRNEKVVIHTHVNELIALSHNKAFKNSNKLTQLLHSMHPEVVINVPKGIGFLSYMLPGTEHIADATVDLLHKHNLIFWEKHGIFAVGHTPLECFDKIDIISKAAKIYLICKMYGFEPEGIDEQHILELKRFFSV